MQKLRNSLFKLMENKTADGYQIGINIDGVNSSDERDAIAKKLVSLKCLSNKWTRIGRSGIQGQFNYDRIEKVINDGEVG